MFLDTVQNLWRGSILLSSFPDTGDSKDRQIYAGRLYYSPHASHVPSEIDAFAGDAFRFLGGMCEVGDKWDPSTSKDPPETKHSLLAVEKLVREIQRCADGITEEVLAEFQGSMDIAQSFCTIDTRLCALIKIRPTQ